MLLAPAAAAVAVLQDVRTLQQHLTTTRTALKQADVRIAILEERILSLQQVRTLFSKQHWAQGGEGWHVGVCAALQPARTSHYQGTCCVCSRWASGGLWVG